MLTYNKEEEHHVEQNLYGRFFLCILLLLTGCGRNSRSDETETFPNETVAEAEEPKEDHMGDAGQRLLLDYLTDIMEEGS